MNYERNSHGIYLRKLHNNWCRGNHSLIAIYLRNSIYNVHQKFVSINSARRNKYLRVKAESDWTH